MRLLGNATKALCIIDLAPKIVIAKRMPPTIRTVLTASLLFVHAPFWEVVLITAEKIDMKITEISCGLL